jgi:hypothetical protein
VTSGALGKPYKWLHPNISSTFRTKKSPPEAIGEDSMENQTPIKRKAPAIALEIQAVRANQVVLNVMFPSHVTSTSAIEKGKWLEWRDTPERTDSSRSNGPVVPDLDLDDEESFIIERLVSADVIEHKTDHALDYGNYGVMSSCLALS